MVLPKTNPGRTKPEKAGTRRVHCKPKACPTCGGTECFERPRYFSGQLLTDRDLDAAQRYVIEKNRLHNRYLVGNGVVCGLAVRCDPCDGVVIVETGYAIDCCGNDIVVCEETSFDVVKYLEACRQEEPDCKGKIPPRSTRCDDREREFCLVLSYAEQSARPMTVLGQGTSGGARCEPSRVQELFRLDLVEDGERAKPKVDGMAVRIADCVTTVAPQVIIFTQRFSAAEKNLDQNPLQFHQEALDIFCDMQSYVRELYAKGLAEDSPRVRCNLDQNFRDLEQAPGFGAAFPAYVEDPERRGEYLRQVHSAIFRMYAATIQYMIDCMCDSTLVPCPECDQDEGVLLACLTVKNNKIEKICNTVRRQVVSGPSLHYWLEPLYTLVRQLLVYLCCQFDPADLFGKRLNRFPPAATFQSLDASFGRGVSTFEMGQDFLRNAVSNLGQVNLMQMMNPQAVMAADFYGRPLKDVRAELKKRNIDVVVRKAATTSEAYTPATFAHMAWHVPEGSKVELVVDPENYVSGLRIVKKEEG